jgi:hypothetical protein
MLSVIMQSVRCAECRGTKFYPPSKIVSNFLRQFSFEIAYDATFMRQCAETSLKGMSQYS